MVARGEFYLYDVFLILHLFSNISLNYSLCLAGTKTLCPHRKASNDLCEGKFDVCCMSCRMCLNTMSGLSPPFHRSKMQTNKKKSISFFQFLLKVLKYIYSLYYKSIFSSSSFIFFKHATIAFTLYSPVFNALLTKL